MEIDIINFNYKLYYINSKITIIKYYFSPKKIKLIPRIYDIKNKINYNICLYINNTIYNIYHNILFICEYCFFVFLFF